VGCSPTSLEAPLVKNNWVNMKRLARRSFLHRAVLLSVACLAPLLLWAVNARVALAEDAPAAANGKDAHSDAAKERLPPPAITEQSIDLGGRIIKFKASIGGMPIKDESSGELLAEVVTTAFVLTSDNDKPAPGACRPIVFAFNGGPGAGSGWLDLGALGPWRLPLTGAASAPSAPPVVSDNRESWLDFADLVFIDPPGTGFSRLDGGEATRKKFWSVEGDVELLASVMRRWLQQARKLDCPKFLVGESYGGFRAPKIARALQEKENIGVDGLVLVSPSLDFGWIEGRNNPLGDASRLPSLAASRSEAKDRSEVAGAESYASGDYLADLLRGPRDAAAQERIAGKVAVLTGLSPERVRRLQGRISAGDWIFESDPSGRSIASLYDGVTREANVTPGRRPQEWSDPVLDGLRAPLAAAMTAMAVEKLKWPVEARYEILNDHVSESWNWGSRRRSLEALSDLRRAQALDPRLKVVVAHGLYDLVAPYYANKLLLDLDPPVGAPDRIIFLALPGGHMFYGVDSSRAALRDAARKMISNE
jgi:carboxypeptidase C (cathepsin A)